MSIFTLSKNNVAYQFQFPNKCPICHSLVVITGYVSYGIFKDFTEIIYYCPNPDCGRLFIGYYSLPGGKLRRFLPSEPSPEEIPPIIKEISPQFVEIYNQAKEAQASGLSQICGPGYRKAFEFLIKDYAKTKASEDATRKTIETSFAGNVVDDYIDDSRAHAVAKRALWLGNDETHYLRIWTDHNIDDLIALIQLTIHWIEIERLSEKYVTGMSEEPGSGEKAA